MSNNKNPFLMTPTAEDDADAPLHEIEHAIRRGNKIRAIKIFRDAYEADLATAKEAIESLQRGETIKVCGKEFKILNPPRLPGIWRNDHHGFSKSVETTLKIVLAFVFALCFLILLYLILLPSPFSFDF